MSDEPHVHGPDCIQARILPLTSEPILIVVVTKDDLDTGQAYIEADMPGRLIPKMLRGLADKIERQNKAGLS